MRTGEGLLRFYIVTDCTDKMTIQICSFKSPQKDFEKINSLLMTPPHQKARKRLDYGRDDKDKELKEVKAEEPEDESPNEEEGGEENEDAQEKRLMRDLLRLRSPKRRRDSIENGSEKVKVPKLDISKFDEAPDVPPVTTTTTTSPATITITTTTSNGTKGSKTTRRSSSASSSPAKKQKRKRGDNEPSSTKRSRLEPDSRRL